MLEAYKFIFSNFWIFFGTLMLVGYFWSTTLDLIFRMWDSFWKHWAEKSRK